MRWLALALLVACGSSRSPQPDGTGGPALAVTVSLWGATADEMEAQVLMPIEHKLAGEPNVATVRSVARPNQGQVVVWFKPGVDNIDAARHANESLSTLWNVLPPGVGFPRLTIGDPEEPPDRALVVTSKSLSIGDASDMLERSVVSVLEIKFGVNRAIVTGARPRELRIAIDAERVRMTGITHSEVIRAVAMTDRFAVEEAGNIEIAQLSHVPVLLRDVADIRLDSSPPISDEPLGIAVWLQKPEQRADMNKAVDEAIKDAPRVLDFADAPPRPPRPALAIELTGEDRAELEAVGQSLISDLRDLATVTREPPDSKEPVRAIVVDEAAAARLNVKPEDVRGVVSSLARAPVRPRVSGTDIAIVFDLGTSLDGILLRATDGAAIPLTMIAKAELKPATPLVRVNLQRAVVLTVELKAGGSVEDVQKLLDKHPRISHHRKERAPSARLVTRKWTQ
jgi:multidrug efflux pump subunit AcrB